MTVTKSEKYVDIPAQVAQQGDDEWKSGRYDEARSHYLQAATLYEDNEDYHGAGQVLNGSQAKRVRFSLSPSISLQCFHRLKPRSLRRRIPAEEDSYENRERDGDCNCS